jgi:hypothetical protein
LFLWWDVVCGTYRSPREVWGKEFNVGVWFWWWLLMNGCFWRSLCCLCREWAVNKCINALQVCSIVLLHWRNQSLMMARVVTPAWMQ